MTSVQKSMPSADPTALLHSLQRQLDEFLGEVFFAVIAVAILFGITNAQTFTYLQNSKKDPKYLRYMIGLLWLFDALQLAMVAHYGFFTLVTNFSNPFVAGRVSWSVCWPILLEETGDFIIRLFYIRRIWIMSNRNLLLSITAMGLNLVALALGLAFMAKLLHLQSFFEISNISWLLFTSNGSGAAADLWIAVCMCYFLFKDKSGFQRTDTMLRKLTVYVIGTGLLTSFAKITCLISYAALPNNGLYVAIYSCISKLYFNALLATLNTRKRLRGEGEGASSNAYQMYRIDNMQIPSSTINVTPFGSAKKSLQSLSGGNSREGQIRSDALTVSIETEAQSQMGGSKTHSGAHTSPLP